MFYIVSDIACKKQEAEEVLGTKTRGLNGKRHTLVDLKFEVKKK